MRAPGFWSAPPERTGLAGTLLSPLQPLTARLTARRLRRVGWKAPVPVVCCGNAGVGGAGKTTLVLDLAARLQRRGIAVHCLTRGYGGSAGRGPVAVDPQRHDAAQVGDEALLLAAVAPCWAGSDRAAAARAAVADGAALLLMDDGLQNPQLVQDLPLLVIDAAVGFGNTRLLPAGPLREPVATAAGRCAFAVAIGESGGSVSEAPFARLLPPGLRLLHAVPRLDPGVAALRGRRVFAFAGIARPEKFFDALEREGLVLAGRRGFADHGRFDDATLRRLHRDAAAAGARLITTPKDAARLSPERREGILVAGLSLHWPDPSGLEELLRRIAAA